MNKHTPGPWKVFNAWQNGNAVNFSRIGNENETIITVQNSDDVTAFKEADLHLIAAAPELLQALENLVEAIEGCKKANFLKYHPESHTGLMMTNAANAIAKAKGEQ